MESLSVFDELIVYDNSVREDVGVYGRYIATREVSNDLVYVQDDDCVVSDPEVIVAELLHRPHGARHVCCNMPPEFRHDFYVDHALVGFGACFERTVPDNCFSKFGQLHREVVPQDFFNRTCDIVVTGLSRRTLVDVPYENLPWASSDNRMWKQPTHVEERARMLELVKKVRDA